MRDIRVQVARAGGLLVRVKLDLPVEITPEILVKLTDGLEKKHLYLAIPYYHEGAYVLGW